MNEISDDELRRELKKHYTTNRFLDIDIAYWMGLLDEVKEDGKVIMYYGVGGGREVSLVKLIEMLGELWEELNGRKTNKKE